MVGARPEVFDEVKDLISLSAPRIVRCGEFGHASIIKIYSNILCAFHDVAVAETLCVAKKEGMDMKLVFDAIRISAGIYIFIYLYICIFIYLYIYTFIYLYIYTFLYIYISIHLYINIFIYLFSF